MESGSDEVGDRARVAVAGCRNGDRKCLGALRRLKKPTVGKDVAQSVVDRMSEVGIIRPIVDTRMIFTEWRQATQVDGIERYVLVAEKCKTNVATVYSVVKRMGA